MRTKVRLLKQNLIVLNEWQSSRLHDSFVFTLNVMYCTCLGVNNCTATLLHKDT